jgi:hypothetical protein
MTQGAQIWPGDRMRAFFRAHIRRETTLDDASAERLSDALTRAINRMLVWDVPPLSAHDASNSSSKVSAEAVKPAFDPYAFSVLAALMKTGRDGLTKKLADIGSVEHLKALAEAQHLAIDPKIKKLDDLRKAIIAATEQRLADRKAAAS